MKILVCGSRRYTNSEKIGQILTELNPTEVIHGDAAGADYIAERWCIKQKVPFRRYPAKWNLHGHAAGPIRNQAMLDAQPDIDLVLAFPLKGSIGTWHMVKIAKAQGFTVRVVQ